MMKLGMLLLLMLITLAAAACTVVGGQDTAMRSGANQIEAEAEPPATTEGPAPTITPVPAPLPIIVQAPGWDNQTWINTDAPLQLEDLRGKVVLLEFWTFG
ncbi:MAG: hypothetical protein ACK2UG_08650 [Candidatus Promineifilaceae bacterium]|jgi:hypothetical protein